MGLFWNCKKKNARIFLRGTSQKQKKPLDHFTFPLKNVGKSKTKGGRKDARICKVEMCPSKKKERGRRKRETEQTSQFHFLPLLLLFSPSSSLDAINFLRRNALKIGEKGGGGGIFQIHFQIRCRRCQEGFFFFYFPSRSVFGKFPVFFFLHAWESECLTVEK